VSPREIQFIVGTVLTITLNPALDVCAQIPVVEPDRKMHCHDVIVDPGGGGVNVARVATRLGATATAAVLIGGASGEQLVALLAAEQIPTAAIHIVGTTRESFTVVETSTHRQYRFVLPGPTVGRTEFAAAAEQIVGLAHGVSIVVLSGSLPPGVTPPDVAALLAEIRATGADVIIDTSGDALEAVARVGALLIKPSVHELSLFAGSTLDSHVEIEAAARRLLSLGANHAIVVSLAAAGALLIEADAPCRWIHAPNVRATSTVGAGDSLVAAMAVALERGETLEAAACSGVAAGTAATLAAGTALCTSADIARLFPLVAMTEVRAPRVR
jgi:6-phosphofructokinase 2